MKNIKKLDFRLYEETYHVIAGNMQHRFGAPYYVHKFISRSVIRAIGFEHLKLCSRNQLHLMDKMLDEKMLSNRRSSDAELVGIFEMIFDHVLPFHELSSLPIIIRHVSTSKGIDEVQSLLCDGKGCERPGGLEIPLY